MRRTCRRPRRIQGVAFLAAAGAGALLALACGSSWAAEGRPNVLFIAVDDLRPQLGCYDCPLVKSPNIDRLAAHALRFERAYCQQAVCAPSRISLLSGRRPDTTNVYDLQTPLQSVHPDFVTLPQQFRRHGYETISLGKIYHHKSDDPKGWSEPPWGPTGYTSWHAYVAPESLAAQKRQRAEAMARYEAARKSGRNVKKPEMGRIAGPAYESPDVADDAYPDGRVAERAIEQMRRLQDRPFFLAVGFVKPHLPFNAPKPYWDLYQRADIAVPSIADWPSGAPRCALTNWSELRAYSDIPPQGTLDEAKTRALIHGYYACVSYTDAQIGKLLDELDRLRLREKTIIVLWGDHGWKLGEYSAWCKHTNFELDAHVPMILSVPGRTGGESTGALVEFVDIAPTLAQLCGLPAPAEWEGLSMVPLLKEPSRPWKTAALSQYPRTSEGKRLMGYSVRTDRWRYTEWIERGTGRVAARELYDHRESSIDETNVASRPENADIVATLSRTLDQGRGWRAVRQAIR